MSDTKLKPCPFCGGKAEEVLYDYKPAIRCKSCHATVYREYFEQVEHAEVIMWNTRKPIKRIIEQLKGKENEAILTAPNTHQSDPNYQKWMMKSYGFKESIEIVKKEGVEC